MAAAEGKSRTIASKLIRGLQGDETWHTDELTAVVHWMRQGVAVVFGVVWGIIPLQGLLGVVLFFLVNVSAVPMICSTMLSVDMDKMGTALSNELSKEGFMASIALFLVAWILTYTALHDE